ncbi:type II toxin-antitoxin system RelE/ParE family toxin [Aerosakkonema sp. BLCC-F183]|uniref:type II toxin-antitoxin system RelE family toxin n=1 Tax=Aerosakkonema sp. BLCC-F183 TaxID=3342834 RepID=UPI0035BA06FD
MRYEIIFDPEAVKDIKNFRADLRGTIRDAIETYLRYEPTKISKSRIKRLRDFLRPQYRLRVDDIRVFYDVAEGVVEVLAVVAKSEAEAWLEKEGEIDEGSNDG